MKHTILGGLAISALLIAAPLSVATAADMPLKAPPPAPVPVYSWTGFYVGLNAGGIFSTSRDTVDPSGCFILAVAPCGGALSNNPLRSDTGNIDKSGFTGGVQAGYNWQNGNWLAGLEADFNGSSMNATDSVNRALAAPLAGNFIHSASERLDWFGTVRGRLGVTPAPQALLYVTGGFAYGEVKSSTNVSFANTTDAYSGSTSTTRGGWTIGAGGEWAFAPTWSAKLEYLYIDLGNFNYSNACITAVCAAFAPPPAYQTDLRVRENVVRVGINHQFTWR
jgi:outer membrane immunogenic protein